jgi:hypothetical protein
MKTEQNPMKVSECCEAEVVFCPTDDNDINEPICTECSKPCDVVEGEERNWVQDFKHENGNYWNECMFCKKSFVGHKRRVVCKVCSDEKNLTPLTP